MENFGQVQRLEEELKKLQIELENYKNKPYLDVDKLIASKNESEAQFHQLIENAPYAIFLQCNSKFVYLNPAALKLYKCTDVNQLLGKSIFEVFPSECHQIVKERIQRLQEDKCPIPLSEYQHLTMDKQNIEVEVSATPIKINNQDGAIVFIRDISDRKNAEQIIQEYVLEVASHNEKNALLIEELQSRNNHIQRINKELLLANEKATESDRLKSAFLANLSHEIRTPMNGIIGFSEMLLNNDITDEKKAYFSQIIIKSGQKLLSIVNDILDISKIDAGQIEIKIEPVNINNVIEELIWFYTSQNNNPELLILHTKGLPDVQSVIRTDKTKVAQILSNLLNNAVKFTSKGCIEFGYVLLDGNLEFYVQDSGIGIPNEYHHLVFERFRQAEIELSRKYGGTGLGLSISQKLVELLGGKIWLTSEPGKGSVFYFTLPYNPTEPLINNEYSILQSFDHEDMGDYKIIVAEDEELNFLYLKEILIDCNFKVLHAENGAEAVKLVNEFPDAKLILMDLKMPVMNGFDAIKIIQSTHQNIPIIAQTAYVMHTEKELVIKAGCAGYISKPIDRNQLMQLIHALVVG
jgi:PAS domain S-box-containing protein